MVFGSSLRGFSPPRELGGEAGREARDPDCPCPEPEERGLDCPRDERLPLSLPDCPEARGADCPSEERCSRSLALGPPPKEPPL